MIAAIREVFSQNSDLDRDSAIREVARALGFERTGSRIAEAVDSALIAAARRGVIQNNRGVLSLLSRSIGDYSRDKLIDTLLSVMGAVWVGARRSDPRRRPATRLQENRFVDRWYLLQTLLKEGVSASILVLTPLPPLLAWRESTAISTPETTAPALTRPRMRNKQKEKSRGKYTQNNRRVSDRSSRRLPDRVYDSIGLRLRRRK